MFNVNYISSKQDGILSYVSSKRWHGASVQATDAILLESHLEAIHHVSVEMWKGLHFHFYSVQRLAHINIGRSTCKHTRLLEVLSVDKRMLGRPSEPAIRSTAASRNLPLSGRDSVGDSIMSNALIYKRKGAVKNCGFSSYDRYLRAAVPGIRTNPPPSDRQ